MWNLTKMDKQNKVETDHRYRGQVHGCQRGMIWGMDKNKKECLCQKEFSYRLEGEIQDGCRKA